MPSRKLIVDGKEIVFMIMDDEQVHPTYDVGIWINPPFFASALRSTGSPRRRRR